MTNKNTDGESPVKKRLLGFIEFKGLTVSAFEKKCGLSNAYVDKINRSISDKMFDARIAPNFPELNKIWLFHGMGDMLNSYDYTQQPTEEPATNVNPKNVIPIYDIEIDAGNITRLIDDNNSVPIAGHVYLRDSLNTSGLVGVRARGDSMSTYIVGGDTMLVRRINNKESIPLGQPYVVVTPEYTVVKYVRKGSDKTTWTLRSHNEFYEDFEVKKSDVIHLFMVVKVLKELTY